MYYEYWGLIKAPFDNVPDPSMYVESHTSVENAIAETLFAIEEGNECISVIVGEIGSGKTLSLRLILDSLQSDRYRIAFITNPNMSFVQLLREIIGQITGKECAIKRKVELLEIFNKLLFETMDEKKRILIFIDEANAISTTNLECLRLLTNMQDDGHNLFTLVLAGQMELAKRLEHPRRANLYQRIGTYSRIDKLASVGQLKEYVQARLLLAGANQMFFNDAAVEALWRHSEQGVPRLINKLCKLCMKAGETNGFLVIDAEVVNQIGERFHRFTGAAKREARFCAPKEQKDQLAQSSGKKEMVPPEVIVEEEVEEKPQVIGTIETERQVSVEQTERLEVTESSQEKEMVPPELIVEEEMEEEPQVIASIEPKRQVSVQQTERVEKQEASWETDIGSFHIKIAVPFDVLREAGLSTWETRTKIAGTLAAQTLQRYPQLAYSPSQDQVALWSSIRKAILSAFERHELTQ
jgi:general secretion pathway protein A